MGMEESLRGVRDLGRRCLGKPKLLAAAASRGRGRPGGSPRLWDEGHVRRGRELEAGGIGKGFLG